MIGNIVSQLLVFCCYWINVVFHSSTLHSRALIAIGSSTILSNGKPHHPYQQCRTQHYQVARTVPSGLHIEISQRVRGRGQTLLSQKYSVMTTLSIHIKISATRSTFLQQGFIKSS